MLPTVPQLPTDNLYKFMAISGLVLLFLGIYIPNKQYDEVLQGRAGLLVAAQELDAKTIFTKMDTFSADLQVDSLSTIVKTLEDDNRRVAATGPSIAAITPPSNGDSAKFRQQLAEAQRQRADVYRRIVEDSFPRTMSMQLRIAQQDGLERNLRLFMYLGIPLALTGVGLMIFGFWKWLRMQRLQDTILAKQASGLENSENGSKSEAKSC